MMRGGAAAVGCMLLAIVWLLLAACMDGYSELEMQLQRDRVERLQRMLDACEAQARASTAVARACSSELR